MDFEPTIAHLDLGSVQTETRKRGHEKSSPEANSTSWMVSKKLWPIDRQEK